MEETHCAPVGGHFGVRKMLATLTSRVWWLRMHSVVSEFIAGCDVCQVTKQSTQRTAGLLAPLPVPSRRFGSWSMDFVVDLPECHGFTGIFTCVDRLTKLVHVCPCRVGEGRLTAHETA